MINKISVMVADDDEEYAKELISYMRGQDDILPVGYALNGQEALELAVLTSPDVIILDILMPQLDGMGFLRRMKKIKNDNMPTIIIMSMSSMPSIVNTAISNGADYFMVKPQPNRTICDTIRDLSTRHDASQKQDTVSDFDTGSVSLERYVTDFLKQLGIPAHLDGYKYMRQAIMMSITDMSVLTPITKRLYPMIATQYSTSKSCVERAMRHAIDVSWSRGNRKMFNDIFGYSIDDNKRRPTNSEYIAMAADDFRLRIKYGALHQ